MGMSRHAFLSPLQRKALQQAHFDLSPREIARYWTLSGEDLDRIRRHRRDSNRFGFAVQLCLLRFPSWPPHRQDRVPLPLLHYVAEQLSIASDHIEEYFQRQPTRSDHLQEVMDLYGFRDFTEAIRNQLTEWAESQSHRWTTPKGLLLALLDEMRRQRIILPAISTLEHWAWRMHQRLEEEAFSRLTDSLSVLQRSELDQMLWPAVDANDQNLTWLRRAMGIPGAKSMLDLLDRLDLIRSVELNPQIAEGINPLLLRQLASRRPRHTLQHLREYPRRKRFGILVAYWPHFEQQLSDELVELFTRLVGRWFNLADKRRWTLFQNNGRRINRKLHDYIVLGRTLLQAQAESLPIEEALEKMGGREKLAARIAEAEALATPLDFSNLDQLTTQYSQARQYAPRFLETLEFRGIARKQSLLRAMETLRVMNRNGDCVLPRSAPRAFMPRRWRPYVFDGEHIDRAYYELCVLSELSGALRSGDVWVPGSRRYLPFEKYLIPAELWKSRSSTKLRLSCTQYLEERGPQMHRELKEVARLLQINQLPDVTLNQGVLSISPLEANAPAEAEMWSDRLYDLLPRIHLSDLLIEVDSWTNFSRHFQHLIRRNLLPIRLSSSP